MIKTQLKTTTSFSIQQIKKLIKIQLKILKFTKLFKL